MQYVKLFEQFVNEAVDLHNAYPYQFAGGAYDEEEGGAEGLTFTFNVPSEEQRLDYEVVLERKHFNYDFSFTTTQGSHYTLTGENDAFRILATVTKILIDIIENYEIQPIPIVVKGARVKYEEEKGVENKRDRIYKTIARRVINNVKPNDPNVSGYEFVDLQRLGFQLNPIYG